MDTIWWMLVKLLLEAIYIELFKIIRVILYYNFYYFLLIKTPLGQTFCKSERTLKELEMACNFIFHARSQDGALLAIFFIIIESKY